MPRLYDATNHRLLGHVSQADIDLLVAQMGAESSKDHDCYVDNDAFLRLTDAGASSTLLDAIKMALDLSGEAAIRWEAD
ncbi:hypothetical protein [Cognatiluteimonas profundi]|uniref:hypothetical protein n=1 Tax=Cognatiluteimonas profundi TaxID=2594501 RepID=UPI00131E457A|nr:hypothetical protein [Lysobacter profundi]